MTEDIMLGIIRKADELGQDEIVVASDEIERLRARIAELEAENEELKKAISKPWMGSARAAYLGAKE